MKFAVIDVETLSPQYRLKVTDVITGIGIRSGDKNWIETIKPSGRRNTDLDEANLIFEATQHLKDIKPDVLTGCYLWRFDLPHLICRINELDYGYNRFTGKHLRLEFEETLNGLKIIDLATTRYVLKELAPKYEKSYLSVEEICKELDVKTKQFPEDLHVWVSARAIAGNSKHLAERLESDLNAEWAILQALLSRNHLQA